MPANASTPANSADVLAIRAMAQAQYSNLGGAESLWVDHTVQPRRAHERELQRERRQRHRPLVPGERDRRHGRRERRPGPDLRPRGREHVLPLHAALAVDRNGDLAIGYTKSNATTNPQIKYAGRLAGDPANTLGQTEQTLIDGTGSQSGNCGASACTRWGDYSGMALDPNGCDFWMTGEYYATTGLNYQTRIGSFHFPGCTTVGNGTLSGTVTDGDNPIAGRPSRSAAGRPTTNGSGHYSFTVPAGTYPTLTASAPGFDPALGLDDPGAERRQRDSQLHAQRVRLLRHLRLRPCGR